MISKSTLNLCIVFIFLLILSLLSVSTHNLLIMLCVIMLAAIYLIAVNYRNIKGSDFIVGLALSISVLLTNYFLSIVVFLCFLASASIMRKYQSTFFYNNSHPKELRRTLFAIFAIGGVLSVLNVLLAQSNYPLHPSLKIQYILNAIQAGVFEEIALRTFLYALCVEMLRTQSFSKIQNFLIYLIMIIPHVLLHSNQGLDFGSFIVLSLLFGLPFAVLQRRVNVLSAIGAHTLVDIVRFCTFGI